MTSRSFSVFSGSSKGIKWIIKDADKVAVEAYSVEVNLYNNNKTELLATVATARENIGIYHAMFDTTTMNLSAGKYVVEFKCLANSNNYVQIDYLVVKEL